MKSLQALSLVCVLVLCTIGCVPMAQTPDAAARVTEKLAEITADGVVSAEELSSFQATLEENYGTASPWPSIAGAIVTAGGTMLATFFGLRYMPNGTFIGGPEARALDKLAHGK